MFLLKLLGHAAIAAVLASSASAHNTSTALNVSAENGESSGKRKKNAEILVASYKCRSIVNHQQI